MSKALPFFKTYAIPFSVYSTPHLDKSDAELECGNFMLVFLSWTVRSCSYSKASKQ